MANRKKHPKMLKELVDDYFDNHPQKTAFKRGMILSLWPKIIGLPIQEQVREVKIRGNRLVLYVSDPSWRHEIHMQRHHISSKLNDAVKDKIIHDVIVKS